jgi:hypothetical protein
VGLTIRPSHSTLSAVGRALDAGRTELVTQWAGFIRRRAAQTHPSTSLPTLERQLRLLIDILIRMTGPVRRQAALLWFDACEHFGQVAASRGLAAGEVVEELQHLRELLIRHLSDIIAALPARYSLATVLRLNRQVDHGIARAVVGYTDALVETLLHQNGVPVYDPDQVDAETIKRLEQLEAGLGKLPDQAR